MAKSKIKDSLKKVLMNELIEKNEIDRLKRVKENSNLQEILMYVDKKQPICNQFTKSLTNEGINFEEVEISNNMEEWNSVKSITGMGTLPTVLTNKNFLILKRDFNNTNQLIGLVKHYANPSFKNPLFEGQMLEKSKTNNYNLFMKINQLEQKLTPVINFINTLQKQLEEEEKGE
tara:strand:- start:6 stop:530 length:525 start_codon:yes stop_codon:yes gene_type:complete